MHDCSISDVMSETKQLYEIHIHRCSSLIESPTSTIASFEWLSPVPSRFDFFFFFFQAEDGIRDLTVTGVQTCALPICVTHRCFVAKAPRFNTLDPARAKGSTFSPGISLYATGCPSRFLTEGLVMVQRSEEHTSELQSQSNLVCRLLLEKKKNNHHAYSRQLIHETHLTERLFLHLAVNRRTHIVGK